MKILNATEKDKKYLYEIYKEEYGERVKEIINCYLKHKHIKLVKDNKKIIGLLLWSVKEGFHHGLCEIEELWIHEKYRRKGLGTKLLKSTIKDIKKYFIKEGYKPRKIFLFTSKENVAARKCYEKQNFKLVAEVGDLFKDNEIELMYVLDLR